MFPWMLDCWYRVKQNYALFTPKTRLCIITCETVITSAVWPTQLIAVTVTEILGAVCKLTCDENGSPKIEIHKCRVNIEILQFSYVHIIILYASLPSPCERNISLTDWHDWNSLPPIDFYILNMLSIHSSGGYFLVSFDPDIPYTFYYVCPCARFPCFPAVIYFSTLSNTWGVYLYL